MRSLIAVVLTVSASLLVGSGQAAPGGPCDLEGTPGPDVLTGTNEKERICGRAGHDVMKGIGGDDKLIGGRGSDEMYGGTGHDSLVGGSGADREFGGPGHDEVLGNGGPDMTRGGGGWDFLRGFAGDDLLVGNIGKDCLNARDDSPGDFVNGGRGEDYSQTDPGDETNSVEHDNSSVCPLPAQP